MGGQTAGQGNEIAFNEAGGVIVEGAATGNRISGNSIHDNDQQGGLGIDLGDDGPTANDPGDVDTGPNMLMNKPVISSAVAGTSGTTVLGTIDTLDPLTTTIEVFANAAPVGKESVEAQLLIAVATPDVVGNWHATALANLTGFVVTATATDSAGNTSEISDFSEVGISPWQSLGFALPGTHGAPVLVGAGPLTPGSDVALILSNALPSSFGFWVLGTSTIFAPLHGGTLVPTPQFLQGFQPDADGNATLLGEWPAFAPSGTTLVVQAWIQDPGGPDGWEASNGVIGISP
jgi:hypothetical protein